jgi:hypothetical protein
MLTLKDAYDAECGDVEIYNFDLLTRCVLLHFVLWND